MSGGAIKDTTANYGFNKINFDFPRWHTYEWANWEKLDATLASLGPGGVVSTSSSTTSTAVSGLMIPYYMYPNNPYSDATVQRLVGLLRAYHDVPVIVIINPSNGPGTVWDGNYEAFIEVLRSAGAKVCGYIGTDYGTRPEEAVKAEIDLWLGVYGLIDGIFLDEQTWETGPGNVGDQFVQLYKRYTDYCHGRGFQIVVANPGTNQQEAYFATRTADIIIVHENTTYPSESVMAGNYPGGHSDYSYTRRAALVYNQPTLDASLLNTLRKNVQWVYVTHDNLTGGLLNPWDELPTYLEALFEELSGGGAAIKVSDTAPVGANPNTLWWESDTSNLHLYYNDGNTSQWVQVNGNAGIGVVYATTEIATADKWIDGKTIYRRTYNCGALPNTTVKNVAHGLPVGTVIVEMKGIAVGTSEGRTTFAIPYADTSSFTANINYSTDTINIIIRTGIDRTSLTGYITLYYTKA